MWRRSWLTLPSRFAVRRSSAARGMRSSAPCAHIIDHLVLGALLGDEDSPTGLEGGHAVAHFVDWGMAPRPADGDSKTGDGMSGHSTIPR